MGVFSNLSKEKTKGGGIIKEKSRTSISDTTQSDLQSCRAAEVRDVSELQRTEVYDFRQIYDLRQTYDLRQVYDIGQVYDLRQVYDDMRALTLKGS